MPGSEASGNKTEVLYEVFFRVAWLTEERTFSHAPAMPTVNQTERNTACIFLLQKLLTFSMDKLYLYLSWKLRFLSSAGRALP